MSDKRASFGGDGNTFFAPAACSPPALGSRRARGVGRVGRRARRGRRVQIPNAPAHEPRGTRRTRRSGPAGRGAPPPPRRNRGSRRDRSARARNSAIGSGGATRSTALQPRAIPEAPGNPPARATTGRREKTESVTNVDTASAILLRQCSLPALASEPAQAITTRRAGSAPQAAPSQLPGGDIRRCVKATINLGGRNCPRQFHHACGQFIRWHMS